MPDTRISPSTLNKGHKLQSIRGGGFSAAFNLSNININTSGPLPSTMAQGPTLTSASQEQVEGVIRGSPIFDYEEPPSLDPSDISDSTNDSTPPGDISSLLAVVPITDMVTVFRGNSESHSVTSTPKMTSPIASTTVMNSLVITFGCISIFVTIINILLLVASKYASGGRTPVLIFIRGLCVADAMTGMFGVSKMSQVITRWQWINCFLPESILVSATIAFNLTQVMLTTMCYSMLKDLVRFDRQQDKHRSIFSMTFLWNGSFIIGFAPHMGWNVDTRMGWNSSSHICLFLKYFSRVYISFVASIVGLSLLWLIIINIALQVLISYHRVRDPSQITLTWPVIRAVRFDIVIQILCYLPAALYLYVPCESCAYHTDDLTANQNLWLFIPLMILKSVCTTALHVSRSPQIRNIITHSIKVFQYQLLILVGQTPKNERPLRPRNSIFVIDTERRPKNGGMSSSPSAENNELKYSIYSYSWRNAIQNKLHQARSPRRQDPPNHEPLRSAQPTIPEEPSNNTLEPGEFSAYPSNSNSNVTLVSSLGSSMQSGSGTNGTVSSKSSVSSGKVSSGRTPNIATIPVSHSVPSHLTQTSATQDSAATSLSRNRANSDGSSGSRQYWEGSLPQRSPQPLLSPIENIADEQQNVPLQTRSPQAHQRHLLWAKSPLASRIKTSSLHTVTKPPRRALKKEALNNGSHSNGSHSRQLGNKYGRTSSNVVQSEVVVHVSADEL